MDNEAPRRPLTELETRLLEHLLSFDFAGSEALRQQLSVVEATAAWTSGSPSIDLRVPDTAPVASTADGPIPVRAFVVDNSGEIEGERLVWVVHGRLSAFEYAWVTDETPQALPPIERVRIEADPGR